MKRIIYVKIISFFSFLLFPAFLSVLSVCSVVNLWFYSISLSFSVCSVVDMAFLTSESQFPLISFWAGSGGTGRTLESRLDAGVRGTIRPGCASSTGKSILMRPRTLAAPWGA
jgi:hypothetical protein